MSPDLEERWTQAQEHWNGGLGFLRPDRPGGPASGRVGWLGLGWGEVAVEVHRRWRGRNKKLIDDPPQLEEQWTQDLKRKAADRHKHAEPKQKQFWPGTLAPRAVKKQKKR